MQHVTQFSQLVDVCMLTKYVPPGVCVYLCVNLRPTRLTGMSRSSHSLSLVFADADQLYHVLFERMLLNCQEMKRRGLEGGVGSEKFKLLL